MLNIVLIEDHIMVQQGFKQIIESTNQYKVSACFSNFSELEKNGLNEQADAYIVDLSLPDKNGFDVIQLIRGTYSNAKILVVSMYEQSHYILAALELNVNGYLSKRAVADDLLIALSFIFKNKEYLSKEITNALELTNKPLSDIFSSLTNRELEIFKLLAYGHPPKKVASLTNTMPKTVFSHRANIFQKLKVNNQFDLLKLALKYELIYLDEYINS